jgi:PAS domain S-box-containing protein
MADILPLVHQRILLAANGRASVLLRLNPRTSELHADSAAGLDSLDPAIWLADAGGRAAAERAWAEQSPIVLAEDSQVAARLAVSRVLLVPLQARDRRLGILVVATNDEQRLADRRDEIAALADLLSMAIERARFRRDADLQQDLRELAANLTSAVSSSMHLGAGLEIFSDRAARLFAADTVSIWFHDRRARQLEVVASSDASRVAGGHRVTSGDESVPAAAAMRQSDARLVLRNADRSPDIFVPLRGRRRALGVLELSGVRIEPGDAIDLLERVEEMGRQLSTALENLWLLESAMRSRRELEITFNSLADLVVVTDRRLRITHANRAFAARVGRQASELADHSLHEFVSQELTKWIECRREPGAGQSAEREIADDRLNGTFVFTASPLIGNEDEHVGTVLIARDITAHARLAAEGAELRNRLTQSEKLAALGQFVAGIAHELNNPLQGVLGHVELMLQTTAPTNRLRRDLKLVFREADRAAKIVHNLLVFAGSRRITRRRLNINHVVNRVVQLRATAMAAAGTHVIKNITPKLPRVAGDPLLLQQALLNIVLNAEQAVAAAEGTRTIEVHTRLSAGPTVEIAIADTGPGIPDQLLSRVFEPFFTTKEVGQGTGLGLAIAYGIVQEHGGHLTARNRTEGGAMFTIALPAGSPEAVE